VLAPGTQIDRYELVCPVGEGGMAQVWVARRRGKHGFEKLFAFKCIHPRFAGDPAFRRMFLDEARIAASIEHRNVAQMFDLGEERGTLYLVMEYVDGESLAALAAASERRAAAAGPGVLPLPLGVALRIVADVCAGLHAAHGLLDAAGHLRGVVHRDVSPHNVLVGLGGDVKLIDFGIAVAKDRLAKATQLGSLKGKLHYMAPEQALQGALGPTADVFATGATLYRLLAGTPPFESENEAATLHKLLTGAAPPPLPAPVPDRVRAVVARSLAHDPTARYPSAHAMRVDLEAAIDAIGEEPDVGAWVADHLSDRARARRQELAARGIDIGGAAGSRPPDGGAGAGRTAPSTVRVPDLGPLPSAGANVAPRVPPGGGIYAGADAFANTNADGRLVSAREVIAGPVPVIAAIGHPPPEERDPPPPPPPRSPVDAGVEIARQPSVMDVRALVARAAAGGSATAPMPQAAPPGAGGPGASAAGAPAPPPASPERAPPRGAPAGAGAAAPRSNARAATREIGQADDPARRRSRIVRIGVGVLVVLLLVAGVLSILPSIIRSKVTEAAHRAGFTVGIGTVSVGLSGVVLRDVTATVPRIAGAVAAHADEILVSGLGGRQVRVRGLAVDLNGPAEKLGVDLALLYETNRAQLAGTAADPRHVSLVDARLVWRDVLGPGTRVEAAPLGAEIDSRGPGLEDIRASIGRFDLTTSKTTFGPWSGSVEHAPASTRARLLFDPPVPDGPSALWVTSPGAPGQLTLRIPRSPLARLGLRPEDLGLPADPSTELEIKLEAGPTPSTRFEIAGQVGLYGARLTNLKTPLDVKVDLFASGLPGKPLDLDRTTVTVGPFVAAVTGTVTTVERNLRLDASWHTAPIPCEKLVRAEARSLGPIAAALQELAHATGAARVTGQAAASGVARFDTRAPDEASLTFLTRDTCGLALFGR